MMKAFLKSFVFAWNGIRVASGGRNFRVQAIVAVGVIILGFVYSLSLYEWIVVTLLIGLVLGLEIMNTSIENLVNLVSPEFHPLAGKVKDLAAAAVLVLSVTSAIVGLLIFLPHIFTD